MWTLLVIASSFITSHANTCPAGTTQVGTRGAVGDSPLGPTMRGPQYTVDLCKSMCTSTYGCKAFTYDNSGLSNVPSCTKYAQDTTSSRIMGWNPGNDQVLCKIGAAAPVNAQGACPAGTTQIGDQGATISVSNEGYGRIQFYDENKAILTAENCRSRCLSNFACKAFTYDDDQYGGFNPTARCSLYATNQQLGGLNDYGNISPYHPNADQILCGVNSRANAESPGLFSLDGVDGNGDTIQLSVYIIYGVIGLVLVNIICLCIHFWNKCTKGNNRRKYKVVSMRSDTETDIECQ